MPKKLVWTEAQDAQIRRLRGEGASWDTVAAVLGCGRYTVIERGRRIGARPPPPDTPPPGPDPERAPLPPGHPESWGAIIADTLLQDCPYPFPVFLP
ncbi:MAG: AsnC family protein [Rhodospirillales bacterium]|nr:AsnC family protein [Rhodospirillales bacterium]